MPELSDDTPPVISSAEVQSAPDAFVIVDVRWYLDGRSGLDAYRAGHIQGARFVDLNRSLAEQQGGMRGRHPLPSPEAFAVALGAIGVGDDHYVVAYDDTGGGTAGRLVWMLRSIGQAAAILDGGLSNWNEPLVTDVSNVTPVARTVRQWPTTLLGDLSSLDALEPDAVVLDARAPERYRGDFEPVDPRAGHIPIAKNLPWTDLLSPGGTLMPKDEIVRRFAEIGVDAASQLVASCGSGVTACMLLVAAEYAGLGRGRLFVPSFSGWSKDPTRAVALGS